MLELKFAIRHQPKQPPDSLNRTMLELKYLIEFPSIVSFGVSQSHHVGIEIRNEERYKHAQWSSQSHHVGIEMSMGHFEVAVTSGSQSHHVGIEMW